MMQNKTITRWLKNFGTVVTNLSMFFVDSHRYLTSRTWWDRSQRGMQQEKDIIDGLLSNDMIRFTCKFKRKYTIQ